MPKIISNKTKDRYNEILKDMNIASEEELDKNKVAALYIICAREYLWINRRSIFDFENKYIKEEVFSTVKGKTERVLVLFAFNLFNTYEDMERMG